MTPEQIARARSMHAHGANPYAIARELGVSRQAVRYWLEKDERRIGRPPTYEVDPRPNVTDAELADLERRYLLAPRDLTAAYMGDPLPGYSALDKGA